MSDILPLGDRVLLQRIDAPSTTPSGLTIPESARETSVLATVIAVGPGRVLDNGTVMPLTLSPGQTVLVSRFGGTEVKHRGVDCVMMHYDDILAYVRV